MDARFALGALCLSLMGAAIDVRSAKVPNWLTCGGLVAGLLIRVCLAGWPALGAGLYGALLGGGVLFFPFLARGIGGGDVKLMAAVGAWVGIDHALALTLATAIAGGVLAIGYVVVHGRIAETFWRVANVIRVPLLSGVQPRPDLYVQPADSIRFPYSLAIAAGALFVFVSVSTRMWR